MSVVRNFKIVWVILTLSILGCQKFHYVPAEYDHSLGELIPKESALKKIKSILIDTKFSGHPRMTNDYRHFAQDGIYDWKKRNLVPYSDCCMKVMVQSAHGALLLFQQREVYYLYFYKNDQQLYYVFFIYKEKEKLREFATAAKSLGVNTCPIP